MQERGRRAVLTLIDTSACFGSIVNAVLSTISLALDRAKSYQALVCPKTTCPCLISFPNRKMALMAKNGRMFSPLVLVGVAVVAVVLLGVGGGLIGAFEACIVDPYTTFCNYVRGPSTTCNQER